MTTIDDQTKTWESLVSLWHDRAFRAGHAGLKKCSAQASRMADRYRKALATGVLEDDTEQERERQARPRVRRIGNRTRFLIIQRDGYRCQVCGSRAADGAELEVDHKLAWSKGGSDDPANLWTLCKVCNSGKSDLPL